MLGLGTKLFDESFKEALCTKTFWRSLTWAMRVKVVSDDNGSTTSTHTWVSVSRLRAHLLPTPFQNAALTPIRPVSGMERAY